MRHFSEKKEQVTCAVRFGSQLQIGFMLFSAKGPLPDTISDFWRMIIQEHCSIIVMLCNLVEHGREKCSAYYPTDVKKPFNVGNTTITLTKQTTSTYGNIMSDWTVQDKSWKDRQLKIRHIQCTSWEDQTAPSDLLPVVEVLHEMAKNPVGHPIVIHCSAGVGRTCTLLGIQLLLERTKKGKDATGVSVMRYLRNRRYGAIQKGIQFVFLHRVVIELLCQAGIKKTSDEKVVKFHEQYQRLLSKQRRIVFAAVESKIKSPPTAKPIPIKPAPEPEVLKTQMDDEDEKPTHSEKKLTAEDITKTIEERLLISMECTGGKEDLPEADFAEFL
ncbi:Protein-tyrosine phosphatase [Trichostrongylus colubriformis]|uniref:Protein-tyrosine phosphatase n=1 Tax=Trichostrongylus colubriformis TaxID=6319 RepID=A0AAN8IEL7_TRICO